MSERQFTRSCPLCGAISPHSASACLRCNYSFSLAGGGQTAWSYKKFVRWIAGVLLALALLFVVAFVALIHAGLRSTTAYQDALRAAKASPVVQTVLGENIHLKVDRPWFSAPIPWLPVRPVFCGTCGLARLRSPLCGCKLIQPLLGIFSSLFPPRACYSIH